MKTNIDLTNVAEFVNETKRRYTAIKTKTVSNVQEEIKNVINPLFVKVLTEGENLTLTEQKEIYQATKKGPYGQLSGEHEMSRINMQERIDPGQSVLGQGRMYENREHIFTTNDGSVEWDLITHATMTPYPTNAKNKTVADLPNKPLMYYMRHGWRDPNNFNHHMKPRPFGNLLAVSAKLDKIFAKVNHPLIKSWGFKEK